MHILSALPMKYTHFASSKSSKISQKQLKKHEMHKLGKRKASEVDFWRFLMIVGVPREAPKCTQMEKMPSKHRSNKKEAKKEATPAVPRVGGHRAASRNARFLLRKVFALIFETNLHTPPLLAECGGFFSLARSPPTLGIERFKGILVNHCPL